MKLAVRFKTSFSRRFSFFSFQKAQVEMAGLASGLLMFVLAVPGDMPAVDAEKEAIEAVQAKIKACIKLIEADKVEMMIEELISPADIERETKIESLEAMVVQFRKDMRLEKFLTVLKTVQSHKPNIIELKSGHIGYDLSKHEGIPEGVPPELVFYKVDKAWYLLPGGPRNK